VFDKVPMGMRVLISPSDVEPVEFSSSSLFIPNRETIAAMPAKALALAREADEAIKAVAVAKTALGGFETVFMRRPVENCGGECTWPRLRCPF
jgi:hypothetical protein